MTVSNASGRGRTGRRGEVRETRCRRWRPVGRERQPAEARPGHAQVTRGPQVQPQGGAQRRPAPPAIAGRSSTRVALADRRGQLLEMADVRVVEEDVDEPVQPAARVEELRGETRVGRRRARRSRSRTVSPVDLDLLQAAGRRAQHGRDPDGAHASSHASKAAKLGGDDRGEPGSDRGSAPGRVAVAARTNARPGVLRPLPVSRATTSSSAPMTPRRRAACGRGRDVTPPAVSG